MSPSNSASSWGEGVYQSLPARKTPCTSFHSVPHPIQCYLGLQRTHECYIRAFGRATRSHTGSQKKHLKGLQAVYNWKGFNNFYKKFINVARWLQKVWLALHWGLIKLQTLHCGQALAELARKPSCPGQELSLTRQTLAAWLQVTQPTASTRQSLRPAAPHLPAGGHEAANPHLPAGGHEASCPSPLCWWP